MSNSHIKSHQFKLIDLRSAGEQMTPEIQLLQIQGVVISCGSMDKTIRKITPLLICAKKGSPRAFQNSVDFRYKNLNNH